jgi:hypothetical protein
MKRNIQEGILVLVNKYGRETEIRYKVDWTLEKGVKKVYHLKQWCDQGASHWRGYDQRWGQKELNEFWGINVKEEIHKDLQNEDRRIEEQYNNFY